MINNKIGYSLPFDFVTGKSLSEYDSIFGSVDGCLSVFQSAGVGSIELRCVTPEAPANITLQAVKKIAEYGMSTTIHGDLPEIDAEKYTMPSMSTLPSDHEWIITLHSYAGTDKSSDWYAKKTVSALLKLLENTGDNIKFAIETNRKQLLRNDPGVTYKCVMDMIDSVDSPRVGACWDFGHTAANIQNGFMDLLPPDKFPCKVIHTHIHDLSNEHKTHFPLTCNRMPLSTFNNSLLRAGYTGCFNLELSIERWSGTATQKRDEILQSIEILSASLASMRKRR